MDARGNLIGLVRVSGEGELWSGEIDLSSSAPSFVLLFTRFEEVVNGQILSLVDRLESEISQLGARFLIADEEALPVNDLQIHPTQRRVSFRASAG